MSPLEHIFTLRFSDDLCSSPIHLCTVSPPQAYFLVWVFFVCFLVVFFSVLPSPNPIPLQGHFGLIEVRNRYVKKLFGFIVLQESYNGLTALCLFKNQGEE